MPRLQLRENCLMAKMLIVTVSGDRHCYPKNLATILQSQYISWQSVTRVIIITVAQTSL